MGGKYVDGYTIYIARSQYAGIKLPAKAIPGKRACYISFNGLEISVERFEVIDRIVLLPLAKKIKENLAKMLNQSEKLQVLTGDAFCFSWEPWDNGKLVTNAFSTDNTGLEEIFICRAADSLMVAKIQPSHCCLFIPYDSLEHRIEHYEVLVYRKKPQMG